MWTYIFLICVAENVIAIGQIFDEVTPAATKRRVALVARYGTPFETEICVDSNNECVQEPDIVKLRRGVPASEDELDIIRRVLPIGGQIDSGTGASRAPNSELSNRSTRCTGRMERAAGALEALQVAPFPNHP